MSDSIAAPALAFMPRAGLRAVEDQRRPIVVVLGMHRSGTSLCSHVLSALGVDMTDNLTAPRLGFLAADNPKGHWERWDIVEYHDRILGSLNRLYGAVTHDFGLPIAWWADPGVTSIRREISAYLEQRMKDGPFGFKDPRTVRLMPIWHQIFAELKLAPKIVYCLRNPAQVARSVHSRDGFSRDLAEYRWLSYNIDFFRYAKGSEFCTIEYETWFQNPTENLIKLRTFLDFPSSYQDGSEIELAVSHIVDHELRHDDFSHDEARQPLIRSVYRLARCAEQDAAARDRLQNIAAEFRSFQQLQAVFEREFDRNATLAARLPEAEREAAALQDALAQADRHAKESQLLLNTARLELASRDSRLNELEAEADRHAKESQLLLNTARLELASRDSRLNELEAELAEVGDLHSALAAVKQSTEENKRSLDTIQRQLTGLSNAISQAKREAQECMAQIRDKLTTENSELRDAFCSAERTIKVAERRAHQVERNAAALANENTALKNELAEAYQVSRAMVQALAMAEAGAGYREPRLGWRQWMRRLFGLVANQLRRQPPASVSFG